MTSFDLEEGSTEIRGGSLGKEANGGGAENPNRSGKEDVSSLPPKMNDSAAVKPSVVEGDEMNEGATTVPKSEQPRQPSAGDEAPTAPPLGDGTLESKGLSAKEEQPEEATVTSKEVGDTGLVKEVKGDTELSAGGQPEKDKEMDGEEKLPHPEGDEKDGKAEKAEKKAIEKAEKKAKKAKEKGKDVFSTADGEKKEVVKGVDVGENEEKDVKVKDEEKQKKKEKKNLEKGEDGKKEKKEKSEKKAADDGEKKEKKEKKKEKKEKKEKKPKVASEKIQKKLEKINAKIGRILAKKEEYELLLKEAQDKEAQEKKLQDEEARERELQGKEAQERAVPASDTAVPQQMAPSPADGHRAHYDRRDSGLRREEGVLLDGFKDGFKSHSDRDHVAPGAELARGSSGSLSRTITLIPAPTEDEEREGEDETSRLLGGTLQEGSNGKPGGIGQEGAKEASNSFPKPENQPLLWQTWIQRQREAVET